MCAHLNGFMLNALKAMVQASKFISITTDEVIIVHNAT